MPSRNYLATAAYFESRAAKASGPRRVQLQAVAALYQQKARGREQGDRDIPVRIDAQAPSARERIAAMFRAFDTSGGTLRNGKPEPSDR